MYVGRFAPSPSGPLHMGSLVCALASFLDAKAHHGRWLLRIEDIDPPREIAGAAAQICQTLDNHGLHWDGEVFYQSQQSERYRSALNALLKKGVAYRCRCTRKRLNTLNNVYDNHCRACNVDEATPSGIRLNTDLAIRSSQKVIHFEDALQGSQTLNFDEDGDFIIHRKDGLFAYQLAVVLDDMYQGITDIVRGSDLLPTTGKQLALMEVFGHTPPNYCHIPVIEDKQGRKLSKQNHAPAIDHRNASHNLFRCLAYLHQHPPHALQDESISTILQWGIAHWDRNAIPHQRAILLSPST